MDVNKVAMLRRKSSYELAEMWESRDSYPPDTITALRTVIGERGLAQPVPDKLADGPEEIVTAFSVRILNQTMGVGEEIARLGTIERALFLRRASLCITPVELALSCADDVGKMHALGTIRQQDLKRIRLKKSVFTPGRQLIKPAMSGAGFGIGLNAVIWFSVHGQSAISGQDAIGLGILVVLGMAMLFVLLSLGKIVWSNLAIVAFESGDGKSIEVAVEDEKVDSLIALFADRNISIEPI